jgi:hypothetical protein
MDRVEIPVMNPTPHLVVILTLACLMILSPPALAQASTNRSSPPKTSLKSSPADHAALSCKECHETATGPTVKGYVPKTTGKPVFDPLPTGFRLDERQVTAINTRCENCHKDRFTEWKASAHAQTFAEAFLNRTHNRIEQPHNDCLRCHAARFEGKIEDIVTPLNVMGPWKLVRSGFSARPVMPCLVCHHVHRETASPVWAKASDPSPTQSAQSTGFYDRREKLFFPLASLPHPQIWQEDKPLKVSTDLRLRNCYQCHAPHASHQAGTSDDRTPRGVHEGLSCLDCHASHTLDARASCAGCHPAVSHCQLDVTRMDTSYRSRASAHDIHCVSCTDCHPNGRASRQ